MELKGNKKEFLWNDIRKFKEYGIAAANERCHQRDDDYRETSEKNICFSVSRGFNEWEKCGTYENPA